MRRALAVWCFALAGFAVAVPAAAAGSGGGGCHRLTEGAGVTVELSGFCFEHGILRVEPGTEVTWTNRDPVDHVVFGTGWALEDTLGPGDTGTYRFTEAGTYPYTCHLHPGMNGVVIVGDGAGTASAAPASLAATPASSGGDGSSGTLGAGAAGAAGGAVAGLAGGRMWRRSRRSA